MKFNREQITKAAEILEGAKVMVLNRGFDDFQNAIITALNTFALVKELTEENEDLRVPRYMLRADGGVELMPTIKSIKAEAVRNMQEKLRAKSEYGTINISPWQLDQIAKEVLEEER